MTFARSAVSFDNPDFVAVTIQSYRHRYGNAAGDPSLESIEAKLAAQPKIAAPTIILQGEADGVQPDAAFEHLDVNFSALHRRRNLPRVGHNLPQEAPDAFAESVLALLQG